jgi:hypothetical protein
MPEKLHKDLEALIPEVRKLTVRVKVWRGIIAALVVISIVLALLIWRVNVTQDCIKTWAVNTTQRSEKLSKPGNKRVDQLMHAFFLAVAAQERTPPDKQADIARLDKLHEQYPGLPSHKKAEKMTDGAIRADLELLKALDTNDLYLKLFKNNPIPKADFNCSLV